MTWPGSLRSTCHSPSPHCFHAGSLKALQHTFQKWNTILSPCTLSCLCCLSSLLHLRIHQGLAYEACFFRNYLLQPPVMAHYAWLARSKRLHSYNPKALHAAYYAPVARYYNALCIAAQRYLFLFTRLFHYAASSIAYIAQMPYHVDIA